MKREHPNNTTSITVHTQESFSGGGNSTAASGSCCYNTMGSSTTTTTTSSSSGGVGKVMNMMWDEEQQKQDTGNDELLAVLGYEVKSSDMPEVARKIEQIEEFIATFQQDGGFSHLGSDTTVHYNPSDLSSWLESMISELNPLSDNGVCSSSLPDSSTTITSFDNNNNNSSTCSNGVLVFDDSSFDSDLTAIPGKAVYPQIQSPASKRLKPNSQITGMVWGGGSGMISNDSASSIQTSRRPVVLDSSSPSSRSVVLVDSQENGIRLVHTLMACAEAIQQENMKVAEALVKQIGFLAVSQAGAMRKVATYFAEALARRIYRLYPTNPHDSAAFTDLLQMHFYETCPYLKFAHFTANQAILEAFAEKTRVHVIDFSMKQGMQWPALLQALALRPGGPPSFRLTGIGPPSHDNTDHLQEVGWKLAQLAETINVEFEYRGFVANSLADLDASMFDIREGETVAVNSIFELHQLLARPGAIDKVLSVVRNLNPQILTVVEQEANHNGPVFLDRFTESLHYYSTLFDSLEGCASAGSNNNNTNTGGLENGVSGGSVTDQDKVMSEVYLGRQICNVVACEGVDRIERHETLTQWRTRLNSAGFQAVHLGSNAFKQASMLLALFAGGDGYRVEENNGCLMLGWHTRPLIATSAWKLG